MAGFVVAFLGDRPDEQVEAEECSLQGAHLVFTAPVLVMGRPRVVVRRRLPAADVREVRPVPSSADLP